LVFFVFQVPNPLALSMILCLYTPSLHATIVSPFAVGLQFRSRGYTCISDFVSQDCMITLHSSDLSQLDITFPQQLENGLLYSDPILMPTTVEHCSPPPPELRDCLPSSVNSNTSPAMV
jgi:hypothetical protein